MHSVSCRDLLGGCRGFEFFHVHFLHIGEVLGGWFFRVHFFLPSGDLLNACFFRVHVLPSGNLLSGWFFRVHVLPCRDDLCIGEQRVDGLQVLGRVQRDVGRGSVHGV